MKDANLSGQVALVTGASRGIGAATAAAKPKKKSVYATRGVIRI